MIPITVNYDHSKPPVGFIQVEDNRITFAFYSPITRTELFELFGCAGIRITEAEMKEDELLIKTGEILEWSFCTNPPFNM